MSKGQSRREIERTRKSRAAVVNRWLGWVTFVTFALPRLAPFLTESGVLISAEITQSLRNIFVALIFVHSVLGVYIYGLPEYTNHGRVWQMYIGFSVFVIFLLNRSFVFVPVMRDITDALLWLPIGLHVLIGLRYFFQRILRRPNYVTLPYYLGGSIARDVSKHLNRSSST